MADSGRCQRCGVVLTLPRASTRHGVVCDKLPPSEETARIILEMGGNVTKFATDHDISRNFALERFRLGMQRLEQSDPGLVQRFWESDAGKMRKMKMARARRATEITKAKRAGEADTYYGKRLCRRCSLILDHPLVKAAGAEHRSCCAWCVEEIGEKQQEREKFFV